MNTSNNVVIVGIVALIVGLAGGYMFANSANDTATPTQGHMSASNDSMVANLQGKTGTAFDLAFIEEMTVHHEGAIDMARLVPQSTSRPELLKLASDIISAQTSEIQMMSQWKTQWANN